jgi:hypothetical protein
MQRWPAGMPLELIVVINRAEPLPAPAHARGKLRGRLQRALRIHPAQRIARRMRVYAGLSQRYAFIESVHFRNNGGQDFGAYDFGYRLLLSQGYDGDVLFMNSSVAGPHEPNWLLKYRDQFYRHENVGLCGISLNSHNTAREPELFAPHVQSYFLFTNMRVLKHALGPRLFQVSPTEKLEVIEQGEIGISARVLDAGYGITAATFPDFIYRHGGNWSIPYGDPRYAERSAAPANTI